MLRLAALCAFGLEKVLSNELLKEGFKPTGRSDGRVLFEADLAGAYRALMRLRTAERVVLLCAEFPAADFDQLFEGVRAAPWEAWLGRDADIRIAKARSRRSALGSVPAIQSVAQKALFSRLQAKYRLSRLPLDGRPAEVRVSVEEDRASVFLDLAGEPLHKRGYRTRAGVAPLKETIAAALVLFSGWKRKRALLDPFCGSGTFPIEAALYAMDASPGASRRFGIDDLALADRRTEDSVRAELRALLDPARDFRVRGSDSDPAMIELARANAERAGVACGYGPGLGKRIVFERAEMGSTHSWEDGGLIIANPPYGERMEDAEEARVTWRAMAGLRDRFPGWSVGVLSPSEDFSREFGAKPARRLKFSNGSMPQVFDLFE